MNEVSLSFLPYKAAAGMVISPLASNKRFVDFDRNDTETVCHDLVLLCIYINFRAHQETPPSF